MDSFSQFILATLKRFCRFFTVFFSYKSRKYNIFSKTNTNRISNSSFYAFRFPISSNSTRIFPIFYIISIILPSINSLLTEIAFFIDMNASTQFSLELLAEIIYRKLVGYKNDEKNTFNKSKPTFALENNNENVNHETDVIMWSLRTSHGKNPVLKQFYTASLGLV